MQSDDLRIRWAPKVRQDKIRRLYQGDARGILDEELLDDVGFALWERCQSIVLVSRRQVACPSCGMIVVYATSAPVPDVITCSGCGWTTTLLKYQNSCRGQDLQGMNAITAFETFAERYPQVQSPRERMILIDRLIHAFHHNLKIGGSTPHRSVSNNLIEGRHDQVIALLDQLTYGEGSTPETRETFKQWRETAQQVQRFRKGRSLRS